MAPRICVIGTTAAVTAILASTAIAYSYVTIVDYDDVCTVQATNPHVISSNDYLFDFGKHYDTKYLADWNPVDLPLFDVDYIVPEKGEMYYGVCITPVARGPPRTVHT